MEKRLETKQMKLTKQTLKRIIKEELNKVLNEKETLKEGSVAYIKDGTPSSDAHIFLPDLLSIGCNICSNIQISSCKDHQRI